MSGWILGPVPRDLDILAVVETNKGIEIHTGTIDETGQLVDLVYQDDIGWSEEQITKWIPLDQAIKLIDNQQTTAETTGDLIADDLLDNIFKHDKKGEIIDPFTTKRIISNLEKSLAKQIHEKGYEFFVRRFFRFYLNEKTTEDTIFALCHALVMIVNLGYMPENHLDIILTHFGVLLE